MLGLGWERSSALRHIQNAGAIEACLPLSSTKPSSLLSRNTIISPQPPLSSPVAPLPAFVTRPAYLRPIATMAALTHSQDVFYNLEDMSVILHIHTYDETLLQLLAIGPTDSQQISKPIDSTYTGQQLSPEQYVYHASGSDKTSLEEAHACTTPSPAQHIAQPPTSFLETFLNRYGKTQMPTYPNTAHPPLPSQIPKCKSAANTQRESVTTSAARSVPRPTTHGNESANTLLGSSRSVNPGDSIQRAACVSAIAGSSSPEGATNHPGRDQDDQQSSPRSGIVHVTAKTCKLTVFSTRDSPCAN